ncbi:MAG: ROK family protein [Acidimicrobiales bacterium]
MTGADVAGADVAGADVAGADVTLARPGEPARRAGGAGPVVGHVTATGSAGPPEHPYTLAIDIGGTGLKASVLDVSGAMLTDRVRVATSYPMPPAGDGGLVPSLVKLVSSLPEADRVSAGFPGMLRAGVVRSAPHFVTKDGPGTEVDHDLLEAWQGYDLASSLAEALGKPTRVANDADVQGLAVVTGAGLEVVVTLGTGFGTGLFLDGQLMPHLEIAHQPFRKGETYNQQLGERTRKEIGEDRWNRRVRKAVANLYELFYYDHLHIGGGNGRRVDCQSLGDLGEKVTIVNNSAGILGGVKLWSGNHLGL